MRRAVCIGNDAYLSPHRLTGCVKDAKAIAKQFDRAGFAVSIYRDMSADGLRHCLAKAVAVLDPGNVLVIYYAGHGVRIPGGNERDGHDEALVGVDLLPLLDDELAAILGKAPPGVAITVILDCCHAATASGVELVSLGGPKARSIKPTREMIAYAAKIPHVESVPGRHVEFAACQADEVALERSGRGDFTRLVEMIFEGRWRGQTNREISDVLLVASAAMLKQTPQLTCPAELLDAPFMGVT